MAYLKDLAAVLHSYYNSVRFLVEDEAQALARSEPAGGHNVGEDAAVVAVEMARLAQRFSSR